MQRGAETFNPTGAVALEDIGTGMETAATAAAATSTGAAELAAAGAEMDNETVNAFRDRHR